MAAPPKQLDPVDCIAQAEPVAAKLREVVAGGAVTFGHVVPAARALLCAAIVRVAKHRVWIVCPDVRSQETIHNELLNWVPNALFLPESERSVVEGALSDPESAAERLAVLQKLSGKERWTVVVTEAGLREPAPSRAALKKLELQIVRGQELDRGGLLAQLDAAGYEHVSQVSQRGQYAVRGGILDLYSFQHVQPVRLEFFGDEIDSIRQFDLDAQTSVLPLEGCTLLLEDASATPKRAVGSIADYLDQKDLTLGVGETWEGARVRLLEAAAEGGVEDFGAAFFEHGLGEFEAGDFVVNEGKRERFFTQLREWRETRQRVFLFCNNEGEVERLHDLIPPVEADALQFRTGVVGGGFAFPAGRMVVLSDAELFGRYRNTRARRLALRRARDIANRSQIDFSELTEGEYVVHLEHGIGRYEGMNRMPRAEGEPEEVLVLAYANDARLYVPLEQSYMVSRYVGIGKRNPALSELGDGKWGRSRRNAEKAVMDYAARLLHMHAERETQQGYAFPPDTKWQQEFESSFLYQETPDQLTAITACKADMESEQPMDRLICGDVGFGKTEVAIRAAFKAVMSGKQVAMLVPTTVLAEQHYRNFRERMSDYPVTVDLLSRYRSPAEQRKTLAGLRDGTVDIVVGTHRLISKDIQFKELGLVVIDEEQRFGVLHKERFKELFRLVDMLTLSATPIPRTLYLSLMGAKDMSTIETPPLNRIPVETLICGYDERIIRDAIKRELARQGQVYFLHNRVQSIEKVRDRIQMLVPEARLIIGHGQMDDYELEEVMQTFLEGRADVLISTTIIESGLDIPNANTIVIDRADRFGLADLYQLRGRVGRAQHKAYAYLMLPREMMTVGEARKRINAIKQYSSLGAGFKIAMRDLEIRGAGNILGTAQSGHIISIGFDLYCSLLRQAVSQLKGEQSRQRVEVAVHLDFVATREARLQPGFAPAYLPIAYLSDATARIQAYRRLNEVTTLAELEALGATWRDRFGALPPAAENLLFLTELKLAAAERKITSVEVKEEKAMFQRKGDYILLGHKFPRLPFGEAGERLRKLLALLRSF